MAGEEFLDTRQDFGYACAGAWSLELELERKEELQIAIEEQQEMGLEGLGEEDKYLIEINLSLISISKQLQVNIRLTGCFPLKQHVMPS